MIPINRKIDKKFLHFYRNFTHFWLVFFLFFKSNLSNMSTLNVIYIKFQSQIFLVLKCAETLNSKIITNNLFALGAIKKIKKKKTKKKILKIHKWRNTLFRCLMRALCNAKEKCPRETMFVIKNLSFPPKSTNFENRWIVFYYYHFFLLYLSAVGTNIFSNLYFLHVLLLEPKSFFDKSFNCHCT